MRMSPAYERSVREAIGEARKAAERADLARDTEAMVRDLTALRTATLKALMTVREAEEVTRAEALKSKEIVA